MSPPSEEAQLGPVVPPKGPQGQQRAPIEQASDPSIHSGDSRPVSCEGTSLADCDFESMSTEDWAKWSKEVSRGRGSGRGSLSTPPVVWGEGKGEGLP